VSWASVSEKPITQNHPKSVHLWWARRPLAACRALLLALLLPDPCDEACPASFKRSAREALQGFYTAGSSDSDLRKKLLDFVGNFSTWESSRNRVYLEISRKLVRAAHPYDPPTIVDPFAGGGSIPFEAMRLGCSAFASDLNPVAALTLKVLLETAPALQEKDFELLAEIAAEVSARASTELSRFYPTRPDHSLPIAYLWARTVVCESPSCGAEIPLVRSWWLAKTPRKQIALSYTIQRTRQGSPPEIAVHVMENPGPGLVPRGTVVRGRAVCPACGAVLGPDRVREQLRSQRGGSKTLFGNLGERVGGARLLAVVAKRLAGGKQYIAPSKEEYDAVHAAHQSLSRLTATLDECGISFIPDEPLPPKGTLGFRIQNYGMTKWSELYSSRQLLALATFARLVRDVPEDDDRTRRIREALALAADRLADFNSALARWAPGRETSAATFGRHALPMLWDFCETNPISGSTGSWQSSTSIMLGVLKYARAMAKVPGTTLLADARRIPLPDECADIWFTDPPYYDAIPYSDLSDFFFVWLKRMLPDHQLMHDPFDPNNHLTPKEPEIVQDSSKTVKGKKKDSNFFEVAMAAAFREGRRILQPTGVGCVVFAHKTTEGWEALISALVRAGLAITASWPISTERSARLRSQASAALSASVHLVCRPRPDDAPVGDWAEVLRELPKRVGDWMERLQSEGIRGADLVFACIGPALEIYSRYSKVVDAEEREIPLGGDPEALEPHRRGFLSYVWEVVGRTALEHVLGTAEAKARNSTAGALEEDARLTALFLWTLQSTNGNGAREKEKNDEDIEEDEEEETPKKKKQGYSLIFDVVRRFAQPLGIHLPEWEGRIIETEKGIVRLLSVKDRAKQLFGEENAQAFADRFERSPEVSLQLKLFPEGERGSGPEIKGHKGRKKKAVGAVSGEALRAKQEATTLDRIHAAMLLQSSGRTNALRALLKAEQDRGPDFLRLANALSALYPKQSEEKRLLDAMLLAIPR